ncbi:DUF1758 domain-containing protein, partial [Trichonephila clavata]
MSEDKDRVACLKRKRSVLRTAVTNTVTKLEHELLETEHIDVDKLEEILEILVTKFESLKCIDNELEPLFGEIEFEEEYTKTEEYNDKVTLTKFRVNKRIRELNKNVSNFPANVSHDVEKINQVYQPNINIEENSVRIKLPKLCIPKFYGDVNQWLNFWNSFESAIHKNVHLNKVDKFNYLKSYLGGTALSTVDGFSISDSTYDAAINLLKERFAREDLLIQTHMRKHSPLMCFVKYKQKENDKNINPKADESRPSENTVLTNQSTFNEIYLQTLVVRISNKGLNHFVRVIIDSGSTKSYISKFVAEKMGLKRIGKETVTHGLFGGLEKTGYHNRYNVQLSRLDTKNEIEIEVMDQKKICATVPKINNAYCLKELREKKIFLSDVSFKSEKCLYEENVNDIHLLLGADVAGKILTGKIEQLSCGLVAMQSILGWTVTDIATLAHHLNHIPEEIKPVADQLKESFYVDNCVASFNSVEELEYSQFESQNLLSSQFDLRGGSCNIYLDNSDNPNNVESNNETVP